MRNAILTVDDSPNEYTHEFVEYLTEQNIKALFFCIGENIERHQDIATSILKGGHEIGNHSFSHRNFNGLSISECVDEINKTEVIINNQYSTVGLQRKRKYFRFPYGAKGDKNKNEIQKLLKECGFENINHMIDVEYVWYKENKLDTDVDVFWTFDCEDYKISSIQNDFNINDVLNHIIDREPINGGSLVAGIGDEIVLIHDHIKTHKLYPEYYKTILLKIEEQEFVFKKIKN